MRSAQLLVTSWIVASSPDEALTTSSAIDQKLSPAFTTLVPSIDVDGSSPIVPGLAGSEGLSSSLSREVVVVVSGTVVVVDGAEVVVASVVVVASLGASEVVVASVLGVRSEERRGGKGCVGRCRFRW